jgi:hypothetical protein
VKKISKRNDKIMKENKDIQMTIENVLNGSDEEYIIKLYLDNPTLNMEVYKKIIYKFYAAIRY